MPDMLVNLYTLPPADGGGSLFREGIAIKRALVPDRDRTAKFVRENFGDGWVPECERAFLNTPVSCYIAVRNRELVGFACYDATARDFFGPIGVRNEARHSGVGRELLLRCLLAMREEGYGYAVIGLVREAAPFYEKAVNAVAIPGSTVEHSIYSNMIRFS